MYLWQFSSAPSPFRNPIHPVLVVTIVGCLALAGASPGLAGESPGCGQMTYRLEGQEVALPSPLTQVMLTVSGPLIEAVVTQEFRNPGAGTINAVYVFPLPEGAAVHAMEMQVGERRIVSVVQEKAQARRTYADAQRAGKRAALVSGLRPNLFRTEVANIGPHEKVAIRLEYLDQAGYEEGWFDLVVPLTFTPRYMPDARPEGTATADTSQVARDRRDLSPPFVAAGAAEFPQVGIDVRLNAGVELADLRSASHELSLQQNGTTWLVGPEQRLVPADRDFLLRWRPTAAAEPRPAVFYEDHGDSRYALVMVVPAEPALAVEPGEPVPTETLYVLDVSGSMDGPSLRQAQRALTTALSHLMPEDRFNLLIFANESRFWRRGFQTATPMTLNTARDWIAGLSAGGGTELHPALLRGQTAFLASGAGTHARRIVLLTDAAVGNEDQLLRESIAALGDIRLHVVGIGRSPNRYLVQRLAGQGGGLSLFVSGDGGAEDTQRFETFLARIARPQWVDPVLEWPLAAGVEGFPERLPAPYAGGLTLWSGRFPAGSDLEGYLRARWQDEYLQVDLPATAAIAAPGIGARWGRLKVADLMAARESGADQDLLRERIVATGLEFGLVTRFTSRVAVEEVVSAAGPATTHRLANGLPAGLTLLGNLPRGGTLTPLWRALGIILLLTGLAGLKARSAGRSC